MKRRQSRNSSEGGNGRKGRAGARKDEEPEIVENPTCPILKKIAQAFVYAKTAVFGEGDGTLGPGSRCIRGMQAPSLTECCMQNKQHTDIDARHRGCAFVLLTQRGFTSKCPVMAQERGNHMAH